MERPDNIRVPPRMKRTTEQGRDRTYFDLCRQAGESSPDPDTRVGCVVVKGRAVLVRGCNAFPRGLDDPTGERSVRPDKYAWIEHAERNAICSAARTGMALAGARMYVELMPCIECARAIIQAGISEVIVSADRMSHYEGDKYIEQHAIAQLMLKEAGVSVRLA
jgi:dCMP deaminase